MVFRSVVLPEPFLPETKTLLPKSISQLTGHVEKSSYPQTKSFKTIRCDAF